MIFACGEPGIGKSRLAREFTHWGEGTQQATMLAAMVCFRLLGWVVILGLPLAFLIRRFQIGSAGGAAH